ncbi:hypothetical protein K4S70_06515 [Staphylococcus epidermidis]|nr:hypothetical protein [Staphylococcus epidermidis]MCG1213951.1 hypothetical protein [Staphylococcus epidermidis]
MVKIKRKLEMTLPELIEWGFKNKVKNREFVTNQANFPVAFNSCGYAEFSDEYSYSPEDTFTVEIEEEITEDTVLPVILEISVNAGFEKAYINYQETIKGILDENIYSEIQTKYIYLQNDDGTMTLVWKDGKLVD